MGNSTKHSKTERQLVEQKFIPGSLWICNKPYWYFYNYNPMLRVRWVYQHTDLRQIKYVQQNNSGSVSGINKEVAITENDPIFLLEKLGNYYTFQYKSNELIKMRDEYIYKFVEDWTYITWAHNQ